MPCTPPKQIKQSVCLSEGHNCWVESQLLSLWRIKCPLAARQPRRRHSAMCSCQGFLARLGVFPKELDTKSLFFNLWRPQVVDCAASPLWARNVPSLAHIFYPFLKGRGAWRLRNGSLHWHALLGLSSKTPFTKGIIIQGLFQRWNLFLLRRMC